MKVAQSCPTLCKPVDCNPPGKAEDVQGLLQARTLEWVAISFSRGSSWPRGQTQASCIAGRFFIIWATREAEACWRTILFVWLSKMSLHPLSSYYPYEFSSHIAWQLLSFPSFTLKFSEFSKGAFSAFTLAPAFPNLFPVSTRGSAFLTDIFLCLHSAHFPNSGGKQKKFLQVGRELFLSLSF